MNRKRQHNILGFTLVETMAAIAILLLVLVTAMNSLMYVVRMERINSVQNELDIQVRTTMERLRQDLRLSSMDYIFVYPQGSPTNSAISFPKARDDDGDGLIELDTDGKIIWDITLVYHVWNATPNELRLTTFDPRDNTLTDAQRQSQLESVVVNGNGYSTFNGQNARTRALFRNLFKWNVRGRGAQFDLYSPQVVRMRNVAIGTALLAPGNHTFKFSCVGKSASSTGYKIGLDQLVVSPCGVEREAEDQLGGATYSGAVPTKEYMAQGAWGANYQLAFPATGPGNTFTLTMENDRWEETNFKGDGALCEDTVVYFDESLSPADFVVALPGHTNAWMASAQTLDLNAKNTSADALKGCAVRVLVRGGSQYDGGAIDNSGPFHCAWFYASTYGKLKIKGAFLARAASLTNYIPDAVNDGIRLQFYYSNGSLAGNEIEIMPGDYARAELPSGSTMYIDKANSYIISYLVDAGVGRAMPAIGQNCIRRTRTEFLRVVIS
jgi:type II secretory pathway pseudopilin PulG